jgi:hypothetical protein
MGNFALAALASLTATVHAGTIVPLHPENWHQHITPDADEASERMLVIFTVQGCKHCSAMMQMMGALAVHLSQDGDPRVGHVDATKHNGIARTFGLMKFPWILLFDGVRYYEYRDQRHLPSLLAFARGGHLAQGSDGRVPRQLQADTSAWWLMAETLWPPMRIALTWSLGVTLTIKGLARFMLWWLRDRRVTVKALRPLGIFAIALAAIVASYVCTFRLRLLDFDGGRGMTTPPISMLMFDGPGRLIGQVGFPLVTLCAVRCAQDFLPLLAAVHPALDPSSLKWSALTAFVGLAVVGAIPLQRDAPAVLAGTAALTTASIVHQSGAAVFFVGAIVHMGLWLRLVAGFEVRCAAGGSTRVPADSPLHRRNAPRSCAFKAGCLVLCFFPLPTAMLLHPASPVRGYLSLTDADAGGLNQYALVTCVAGFFASYTLELDSLAQWQASSDARTKKES